MSSWRDTTPQHAQDDLDAIMAAAHELVERRLRAGALVPFAMSYDGEGFAMYMADPGEIDDRATLDGQAMVDDLIEGLRAQRESHRAVAIAADSTVGGGDVVQVWLEHADPGAPALRVVIPYRRRWGRVRIGDPGLEEGSARVWT